MPILIGCEALKRNSAAFCVADLGGGSLRLSLHCAFPPFPTQAISEEKHGKLHVIFIVRPPRGMHFPTRTRKKSLTPGTELATKTKEN